MHFVSHKSHYHIFSGIHRSKIHQIGLTGEPHSVLPQLAPMNICYRSTHMQSHSGQPDGPDPSSWFPSQPSRSHTDSVELQVQLGRGSFRVGHEATDEPPQLNPARTPLGGCSAWTATIAEGRPTGPVAPSDSLDRPGSRRRGPAAACWPPECAPPGGPLCTPPQRAHAPDVAPARSWTRFSSHWCHGILGHFARPMRAVLCHIDLFESGCVGRIQARRYL
jgi:hypothetical protein